MARLTTYQERLFYFQVPLPARVFVGLKAKARLEEDTFRLHAHLRPQERKRAQIITLQQELIAEELERDGSDPEQEKESKRCTVFFVTKA